MKSMTEKMAAITLICLLSIATTVSIGAETEKAGKAGKTGKTLKAAKAATGLKGPKLVPQTTCPIMGGKIDKKLYVDTSGYRIYVCCPGCLKPVKENPRKAIAALKAKGERPETKLLLCAKCGHLKGTKKCCAKDNIRCSECGLAKRSIGCCNTDLLHILGLGTDDPGEIGTNTAPLKPQATCPMTGGKIDKSLYVDTAGHRIYVCCKGCIAKVEADPQKALSTLKAKGEKTEIRLEICGKCGQVKGTKKCCAKTATKCDKPGCRFIKGSVGCCKPQVLHIVGGESDYL